MMKLGGSITGAFESPLKWGRALEESEFSAVTCPVTYAASDGDIAGVLAEAERLDVVIAEVGVWKNPLSPDRAEREAALEYAKRQLAFADEIGAGCCVNIVGARGTVWDGAYRDNYSQEAYRAIVDSIREIIDAVRPKHTWYTIESMPWMVPDGPDEYLKLIQDVDRERFMVHLDFVNMIHSPRRFLFYEEFLEACFQKLKPYIKSCHAKDIVLERGFTTMLRETAPGKGMLDYEKVLRIASGHLAPETPFLLEHMDTDEEYREAFRHVLGAAEKAGVSVK